MMPSSAPLSPRPRPPAARRRRGYSLIEVLIALSLFGVLMTAVTRQLIEGITLSLKTARLLEYSQQGRLLIDRVANDFRKTQVLTIYTSFTDRTQVGSGAFGDYVVMHEINSSGTITRTIGYYITAGANGTSRLQRHDSDDGVLTPGTLPATGTAGSHTTVVRTVRVPDGARLFRNWRNLGFTLRGQFGTAEGATGNLEYVQTTFTTRT